VSDIAMGLDEAVNLTRTGDVWLFRGRAMADRAIQVATNSPVNHVGMAVVIDDLPPLMWHAELGRSLPDLWSGTHHRGVQLHDLRDAAVVWGNRYDQRAWMRQLDHPVSRDMEDAILRTIARLDGTPFPSAIRLAGRWLRGRAPMRGTSDGHLETAYCAEILAVTYEAMGLLPGGRRPPQLRQRVGVAAVDGRQVIQQRAIKIKQNSPETHEWNDKHEARETGRKPQGGWPVPS